MILTRGTVERFGNRGFGFVKQDCDCVSSSSIGNKCANGHDRPVFIHIDNMQTVEVVRAGVRFSRDHQQALQHLLPPREGQRVIMLVYSNYKGFAAYAWTYELLWDMSEALVKQSREASVQEQVHG